MIEYLINWYIYIYNSNAIQKYVQLNDHQPSIPLEIKKRNYAIINNASNNDVINSRNLLSIESDLRNVIKNWRTAWLERADKETQAENVVYKIQNNMHFKIIKTIGLISAG